MAVTTIVGPNRITVKAGKTTKANASTDGTDKEQKIVYTVVDGNFQVEDNGVIKADQVRVQEVGHLAMTSVKNPAVTKIVEIVIKPLPPLKIKPGKSLEVISGSTIQFGHDFELPVNLYWLINNFEMGKGHIDAVTGLYTAPDVISAEKEIEINVIDRNSGQTASANIRLLPIEIGKGAQAKIYAGQDPVRLNIWAYRNTAGPDNIICRIVSRPIFGSITENGIYTPPKRISEPKIIKVEAASKHDSSKRNVIEFELGFPLCPKCHLRETDRDGRCPDCGVAITPVRERCPRCQSSRWDGYKCPTCNYPSQRKPIK